MSKQQRDDDSEVVMKGYCRTKERETWKWLWRWLAAGGIVLLAMGGGLWALMDQVFAANRQSAEAMKMATQVSGDLKTQLEASKEFRLATRDTLSKMEAKLNSIEAFLRDGHDHKNP